ncbi:MAG: hypothetical protein ABIP79_17635 [Chitinophagaceae bacterium]
MMRYSFYWLALCAIIAVGCQKELSFEGSNSPAAGSLQADITGDCLPKTVNGVYEAGKTLVSDTNTITVSVNVVTTGNYVITTDTVNGYFFRATGIFTTAGINTIKLRSNGTPLGAGTNNFVVTFDSSVCDIQIPVLPAGAGVPATFTLVNGGTPTNCATAVVNGTYTKDVVVTGANSADISVNVTTPGAYTITATGGGLTFSKTGVFAVSGIQIINLPVTGTPTTVGANTITFAAPFASCNFTVAVTGPATGTLKGAPATCTPATISGIYINGNSLTAENKVQVTVDITAAGTYNITTNTVAGFSFAGSGTLGVGNNQTIDLAGTGTPSASGPQVFTVTFGASSCTFTVNVIPSDYFPRTTGSNWSYEYDDDVNDSLYRVVIAPTKVVPAGTFNIFMSNDGTPPLPALDSSGYYRKNAGDYFEWFDAGTFVGYDNPAWTEYIFLKDNVAAGSAAWKTPVGGFAGTVSGTPLNIRFSYRVLSKDIATSIVTSTGTYNYQNVIVVEEKLEVEVTPGMWQDATIALDYYGKSYYARGIGLIKFEALNAANAVTFKMELRRFQIN